MNIRRELVFSCGFQEHSVDKTTKQTAEIEVKAHKTFAKSAQEEHHTHGMFSVRPCIPRKTCPTSPTMKQKLLSVCGYQKKETSSHAQTCEEDTVDEASEAQIRDEIKLVQEAMLRALTRCNAMGLGVQAQQTLLRGVLQRADVSRTPGSPRAHPTGAREQSSRRNSIL